MRPTFQVYALLILNAVFNCIQSKAQIITIEFEYANYNMTCSYIDSLYLSGHGKLYDRLSYGDRIEIPVNDSVLPKKQIITVYKGEYFIGQTELSMSEILHKDSKLILQLCNYIPSKLIPISDLSAIRDLRDSRIKFFVFYYENRKVSSPEILEYLNQRELTIQYAKPQSQHEIEGYIRYNNYIIKKIDWPDKVKEYLKSLY